MISLPPHVIMLPKLYEFVMLQEEEQEICRGFANQMVHTVDLKLTNPQVLLFAVEIGFFNFRIIHLPCAEIFRFK